MELLKSKQDCCGCRTCEKVCPKQAITMVEDKCGFLYPQISPEKCIDCGLCLKKCAFQSGYKTRKEFEPFYGYGARHKLEKTYMHSRSGGAFVAISVLFLNKRGQSMELAIVKEMTFIESSINGQLPNMQETNFVVLNMSKVTLQTPFHLSKVI